MHSYAIIEDNFQIAKDACLKKEQDFRKNLSSDDNMYPNNSIDLLSKTDGYLVKIEFEKLQKLINNLDIKLVCESKIGSL